MADTRKVALVTGASSGIGRACTDLLVAKGYLVYGASRSGRVAQGVQSLVLDITDAEATRQAVGQLIAATGRLDTVIHAAGISDAAPLEVTPLKQARQVMDTNFFGTLHIIQATGPHLRAGETGALVVISSISGAMGIPYFGVYSASKAAVERLVESSRLEMSLAGVRIISVAPGDTNTNIENSWVKMPLDEVPDYYRESYRQTMASMHENNQQSMEPTAVAEAVWSALQKKRPAVRYYVGTLTQKAAPFAKRLLPSAWFERIIASFYKL